MNTIFTLSIWGSLLALLVLIIGLFTKNKFYKTLQYYMWLIVLIRFIVPFFPEITLKTTTTLQHTIIPQQVSVDQEMLTPVNIDNNYEVSEQDIVVKNKVNILKLIKDYIGVIYFIGFILVTILNILVYINFKIKVFKYNINVNYNENYTFVFNRCKYQAKIKRKINLFLNSYISTPMLIGIFKPTVLIPEEKFKEEDLELIFKHELMHYKRKDMLVKHIANLAVCIHWFNPLIYLVRNQINKYCELSCDEAVIKILDEKYYKAYGNIILRIAQNNVDKNMAFVSTLNGDKNILKERLVLIMNYKKISKKAIALSTSLLISMSTVAVFSGTTFANSQVSNAVADDNSLQEKRLTINDLTKEEIELFSNILDKGGNFPEDPNSKSVYGINRKTSESEGNRIGKYEYTQLQPKTDMPVDDKTKDVYYDTNELVFIFPQRELTDDEILQFCKFREKLSVVDVERQEKAHQEQQRRELEKLTDKDITKDKAIELAKSEVKNLYPEIEVDLLSIDANFDSKLKLWSVYLSSPQNSVENSNSVFNFWFITVKINSETKEILEFKNDTEKLKRSDNFDMEKAKKTDIWKTEAEKFLKNHLGETRIPISIFSYAYPQMNIKNEASPGNTICTVFKYSDNSFRRVYMAYDTHKIIGHEYERAIDINNRLGLSTESAEYLKQTTGNSFYIDSPEDVKYLITVYK